MATKLYRYRKNSAAVYMLRQRFTCQTNITGYYHIIATPEAKPMVEISPSGLLTIYPGYTWDGNSPKRVVFGAVLGIPEGDLHESGYATTYYATLIHDALYQLSNHTFSSDDRIKADELFYDTLKSYEFPLAGLYYYAIRLFGGGLWGPD